ncbi:MAG: transcriptional repressor [Rudaea sp.]|nr:transcriptional repressor [Rudaea sp.]
MKQSRLKAARDGKEILSNAAELLARRGMRFTTVRRLVLELLCREQKAIGAYDLASALEALSGRRVAANTVYRALDFLAEQGLVAHLASTRTYVARIHHDGAESSVFFVCTECGETTERQEPNVQRAVRTAANAIGFIARARAIDVEGFCKACTQGRRPERFRLRTASSKA